MLTATDVYVFVLVGFYLRYLIYDHSAVFEKRKDEKRKVTNVAWLNFGLAVITESTMLRIYATVR